MVIRLAQNVRVLGSISALVIIFPIFITPQYWCRDQDPVQATRCVVVEPTLCMDTQGHYLYVCDCMH